MARLFTQEDIDRMKAMNKDMTGVEVGTLMLPNELEDLGYGSAAEDPATEPVTAPVVEAAPVATSVTTPCRCAGYRRRGDTPAATGPAGRSSHSDRSIRKPEQNAAPDVGVFRAI